MSHYDDERLIGSETPAKKKPVKRKSKKAVNKGGRPKFEVDYSKLDAMCAIHCTGEESAAILGVDYDTLNKALKRDGKGGFTEYFKQKGANGKMSLRRKQYDQAMSGNATMLIWLGKQWLGQVDKQPEEIKESNAPITINFVDAVKPDAD